MSAPSKPGGRLRRFYSRRLEFVPAAQQPRPMRVGAIGLVVIVLALAMAYTHRVPFVGQGGSLVRAQIGPSEPLSHRTKVRVGGVDVGHVDHVEAARDRRTAVLVMRITDDHVQVKRDARLVIRPRTILSGSFEVELQPGSPSAAPLGSHVIPLSATRTQTDWDQFNQPMQYHTRLQQRRVLRGLRSTFAQPAQIGATLHVLGHRLSVIGAGTGALRGQQPGELRRLVADTGKTVAALSREQGALEELVTGADRTLAATTQRRRELGQMVELSPRALDSTTLTMRRLETTLDHLDPLVAQLRPGARELAPATRALRPGLDQTQRLLDATVPLLRPARPALRDLGAMGRQGVPLVAGLQPTLRRLDSELLPYLRRRDPDTRLLNYESIGPFFAALGGVAGEFDAEGYFLHFATNLGPDSVMVPCGPDLNLQQRGRCALLDQVLAKFFGAPAR
jgi:ABC-type transporter Mla subunit MlaD